MDSPYGNFIVIDSETGGIPSKGKEAFTDIALTELALVVVSQGLEIIHQDSWLIKPYKEDLIFEKAAEIASGISRKMVEEQGLELEVVHKAVQSVLKKYKFGSKLPTVVFHNMKFDIPFLVNMFEFCKDDFTKYVKDEPEDTLKWSRMCWQESVNYKLGTCCLNAGVTLVDAHRALSDSLATARLWIYFQNNLRGNNKSASSTPIKKFRDTFEL
jgi:DNA polymerase III epsilon subunit-like protein